MSKAFDDKTAEEQLISSSPGFLRLVFAVGPFIFGSFLVMMLVDKYVIHTVTSATLAGATMVIVGFVVFFAAFLFVRFKSADAVYAKANVLCVSKGVDRTEIPYAEIQEMTIFRGNAGPIAWVRLRNPSTFGKSFLFMVESDYKTAWRLKPSTRPLWKLLNDGGQSI